MLNPTAPERRPWQKTFIDQLGPLPKSPWKEDLIVLVDGLTKNYVAGSSAENYGRRIRFSKKVFLSYGRLDVLVSD